MKAQVKDHAKSIAIVTLGAIAIFAMLTSLGGFVDGDQTVSVIASGVGTGALAGLDHLTGIFS